jgi:hypothetical protein
MTKIVEIFQGGGLRAAPFCNSGKITMRPQKSGTDLVVVNEGRVVLYKCINRRS